MLHHVTARLKHGVGAAAAFGNEGLSQPHARERERELFWGGENKIVNCLLTCLSH